MLPYDYIIVGGGLAGITLSYKLHQLKKRIILFSVDEQGQASKVASGIANPIVLKTLNKVWNAEILMDVAKNYYRQTEIELGQKIFHDLEIIRLFNSNYDYNEWMVKSTDEYLKKYLFTCENFRLHNIIHDFGCGVLKNCFWLDTKKYISLIEKILQENDILRKQKLEYKYLKVNDNLIQYTDVCAKRIVFCEGAFALNNPYFPKKILKPVKGEELTLKVALNTNFAIKKQLMILPIDHQHIKIGSNYQWDYTHHLPESTVTQKFINELKKIIKTDEDFTITNHEAGIRPASRDRKPIVGKHPEYNNLYFLNGLGTRGVMLAPYLSELLINYFENGTTINEEINVNRIYQ
jgi:glycine/D-amino acid oxidase-like deaminating enzyme